ncbi:Xyloglucan-specific endo-beta-14-glucanase A protein [Rutstroemia sp. NJR-2017a BBW]|nr:Xyloglucan-specific endo-beta-14-glucanase A protein [Rutstroemia sp. NJR-2017a BBW]
MKFTQVALPLLFSGAAIAAPAVSKTINARSTKVCGQWDSVVTGSYTIYQDLWGQGNADSGSQCSTVNSMSGETVSWSTSWSWTGGSSDVKSYANVALTKTGVQLSSISAIPGVWKWSYTGSNIVADVSWDLFTASTAGGTNEFEIMIWLAALGGAGPISSTGSPVATATIAGSSFKLYSGPNGDTTVYSFVAVNEVTSFDGDLMDFFDYLVKNEGFSTSQYLNTLEAGTEPFTGSNAVFSVSAYSVSISQGSSTSTSSTAVVSSVASSTSTTAPSSTVISSAVSTSTSSTLPSSTQIAVPSSTLKTSSTSTFVAPSSSSTAVVSTASSSAYTAPAPTTTSTKAAVAPSVSSTVVSAPSSAQYTQPAYSASSVISSVAAPSSTAAPEGDDDVCYE